MSQNITQKQLEINHLTNEIDECKKDKQNLELRLKNIEMHNIQIEQQNTNFHQNTLLLDDKVKSLTLENTKLQNDLDDIQNKLKLHDQKLSQSTTSYNSERSELMITIDTLKKVIKAFNK